MKRFFANLKLSAKLGAGFGLCLVLALAMGLVAIQQFGVIGQATSRAAYATKMLGIADNLETDVLKQTRAVKTLLIVTSDADNAKYSAEAKELYKQVQDDIDNLKKETKTEAGRKTAQIASESWSAFQPINDEVVTLGLANKNQEADKVLIEKGGPILETLENSLSEYREAKLKESGDAGKFAQVAGEGATKLVLAFLFFAILSGVVAATLLTKAITKVVAQIRERLHSVTERCATDLTLGLEALARGDLTVPAVAVTQPLGINTTDELGQISQTFDVMLTKFHGMIASYTKAKDSLAEVVHQLAQSSIHVSSTSQTLAATAQETGAASSEIASGSYKLATNSSEAAQIVDRLVNQVKAVGESSQNQLDLVSDSSQVLAQASSGIEEVAAAAETMAATANEGNRSVGETVSAMNRIQATVATSSARVAELAEKGQQIGDIVSVIEGIAEQTNLLALNAAIEAARAGEQGRGFAVVAEEVRKLAEEAGSSTRKVADLIGSVKSTVQETVEAIEETTAEAKIGSEKSEKAGLALKEILQNAEEVAVQAESVANLTTNATHSIGAVAAAAKANAELASEMAAGADQVGSAITSVAAFSEQAAASAEELSASVEEVGASASELAKMSQDLETIVSTFKVDNQSAPSRNKLKVAA